MSEYINHVRLTLDSHEPQPRTIEMRWAPVQEEGAASATGASQLAMRCVAEAGKALVRAEAAFFALVNVVGTGEHTLTCTTHRADWSGVGSVRLFLDGSDRVSWEEADAVSFWTAIAGGFVPDSVGAVIVRTTGAESADSVRAWTVDAAQRWLLPCSAEQVHEGYRQASRGEPGPEPDLIYRAAESLPF
ncbi:hypothetical protein [Streptomyces sp. NPDC091219]|uniref:hypothetical protein n=1 Tax=Streptomyces sp. NPDC091219 TaxID=3155193 RepID=UPI003450A079